MVDSTANVTLYDDDDEDDDNYDIMSIIITIT